jgi:hypothetical protein
MTDFEEFAARLQRTAEQHLNACLEAMESWDAGGEADSPAHAPFDGCNTCVVREVLMVALDEIYEYVKGHPDEFAR